MFRSLRRYLPRLGRWPRIVLAGACLLLAANSALAARTAAARSGDVPVVVAARALAPGHRLGAGDVRVERRPARWRPAGARAGPAAVLGERLAGALATGEPITAQRLLGRGLTAGLARGLLAVPVTVAGPRLADLVRPGDRIDLLTAPTADATLVDGQPAAAATPAPVTLGTGLLVLAVLPGSDTGAADPASTDLVVAADRATALRIARAAGQPLAAMIDPP